MAIVTQEDRHFMARCLRELLDKTFILGDLEKDERMYKFIRTHLEDAREALLVLGYDLQIDENVKVVMLIQDESVNEVQGLKRRNLQRFSTEQLRIMFVLWSLYLSKSLVDKEVLTDVGTINDNIEMNQFKIPPAKREEALKLFKRFKLIHYNGDERKDKTVVEIYPSIMFGMPGDLVNKKQAELMRKINELAGTDDDAQESGAAEEEKEE